MIDAFLLWNESSMLRARLDYYRDVVDRFVIVEATQDHAGRPHELTFPKVAMEYGDLDIRYVLVSQPEEEGREIVLPYNVKVYDVVGMPGGTNRWPRVWWARNAIVMGLDDAPDDAIIAISDIDEFPHKEHYRACQKLDAADRAKFYPVAYDCLPVTTCNQDFYYYDLHTLNARKWPGTRITNVFSVKKWTPEWVRQTNDSAINSGWHFSYFGGTDAIQEKIKAIAEGMWLDRPDVTDKDAIAAKVLASADLYGRPGEIWDRRSLVDPQTPNGVQSFVRSYAK